MTSFPEHRGRRLRRTEGLRGLVRETRLEPARLILPLFVVEGEGVREGVPSMAGVERTSVDELARDAAEAAELGLGGVLLFGV
ncbi:MAG: porphobilinogen synthase, partial [Gemmatimonadetes bacterium]|nr:porphobilinogen synthase [Gemmatimonadota bacterium]